MPFLSMWLTSWPHMLTWVTVRRYSHLSLRGCLALQQYFVAHGRVNQLTHQMAPVAHSIQQKHLCRCRELNLVALAESQHATTTPFKPPYCLRLAQNGPIPLLQNWKAAKALLVIIPLLGITYIITIAGPTDKESIAYHIFQHVRAILLSIQVSRLGKEKWTISFITRTVLISGFCRHSSILLSQHRDSKYSQKPMGKISGNPFFIEYKKRIGTFSVTFGQKVLEEYNQKKL
jgi:hypothetical protein